MENGSPWILLIAALALACLADIGRSQESSDTQTQPPAGILAWNEAAETQAGDKNTDSSDYLRSIIELRLAPVPLKLGDGVPALRRSLEEGTARYKRLQKLIGEGNFVLAISGGATPKRAGLPSPPPTTTFIGSRTARLPGIGTR